MCSAKPPAWNNEVNWNISMVAFLDVSDVCVCDCVCSCLLHTEYQNPCFSNNVRTFWPVLTTSKDWGLKCVFKILVRIGFRSGLGGLDGKVRSCGMLYVYGRPHKHSSTRMCVRVCLCVWLAFLWVSFVWICVFECIDFIHMASTANSDICTPVRVTCRRILSLQKCSDIYDINYVSCMQISHMYIHVYIRVYIDWESEGSAQDLICS